MPSMHISLTDELMSLVQQKVASGMYGDASEVIREAIRGLDMHERIHELQLARLKDVLEPGLAQAAGAAYVDYSFDALMAEVDRDMPQG